MLILESVQDDGFFEVLDSMGPWEPFPHWTAFGEKTGFSVMSFFFEIECWPNPSDL